MKKIILAFICLSFVVLTKAQPLWNTQLNAITGTVNPNFGTTTNHPINFYTNNTLRMTLSNAGALKVNGLAGSGSRFLQADATGELRVWTGSIPDGNKILFGNNTWKTFPFNIDGSDVYIDPGKKFGIGVASPTTELDVSGSGNFTGNLNIGGSITINGQSIHGVRATATDPAILVFGGSSQGLPWIPACFGIPGWIPISAQIYPDIIQIQGTASVLNMGIVSTGDGVISVQPKAYGVPKLKINPACNNDVEICQGGGFTKIFNSASIGSTLSIGPGTNLAPGSQMNLFLSSAATKALTITDPALTTSNKKIFEISKAGEMIVGLDVTHSPGTMLTIGQPQFNQPALSVIFDSGSQNIPVFKVFGDGHTEIRAINNQAISVMDGGGGPIFNIDTYGKTEITASSTDALIIKNGVGSTNFNIKPDGKTYIASNVGIGTQPSTNTFLSVNAGSNSSNSDLLSVGSLNTPNALKIDHKGMTLINVNGISTGSVFKIKSSSTDVFAIRYDGVAFAREVIVTLASFPDYVFAKEYTLLDLETVKAYIKKNHRLPNMPSAEEVKKNGAAIGEIQRLTVEKVEELYLYIFQLEEKIEALNAQIKSIEKK